MEHRIKKRGLSDVVTTVLIILVAIIAVGIIGVVVNNFVKTGANKIDMQTECQALTFEASKCTYAGTTATVAYNRGAGVGKATLKNVEVILTKADGSNTVNELGPITELNGATTAFTSIAVKPESASVAAKLTSPDGLSTYACPESAPVGCV